MKQLVWATSLAAIMATTAACGGDTAEPSAQAQGEDGACAAAQDERALTWYSSQDPARNGEVIDAFTDEYPELNVTELRLASGALATRYSQEREAGVRNAGLVTLASPEFMAAGKEAGWFEDFDRSEYPELEDLPDDYFDAGAATTGINLFGIGVNTNEVDELPTSWEDMTSPEFKDKIIFGDPRNVPAYLSLVAIWRDEFGPEFLEQLRAQNMTVVDSMVPGTQQLAAGEGAVALPSVLATLLPVKEAGAPLEFAVPDITTGVEFESVIPTENPSPNAAECFYRFLFTEEGQKAFNGENSASPLGVEGTAPLPDGYVRPESGFTDEERSEIYSLLGLE